MQANKNEIAAFNVGRQIVASLTVIAGAIVALSGICTVIGYTFVRAYAATIGAEWILNLLPLRSVIGEGAPFAMASAVIVTLALFIYSVEARLPRVRTLVLFWLLCLLLLIPTFGVFGWSGTLFLASISTAALVTLILPRYLIWSARAWSDRKAGVLAFLMLAGGAFVVVPALAGIGRGMIQRHTATDQSKVVLGGAEAGDWRLVMAIEQRLVLTNIAEGNAFKTFKVVDVVEANAIYASKGSTPWAPSKP